MADKNENIITWLVINKVLTDIVSKSKPKNKDSASR